MFGSPKTSNGAGPFAKDGLTGLERAKLERSQLEPLPQDEAIALAEPLPSVRSAVQKKSPGTRPQPDDAAHLYVGANIHLKGEIAGCDLMRVEGTFEGTAQTRQLVLCPDGSFIGTALVEEADIEGAFNGTLKVRGRLFLRAKGRVRGNFSYGQIEIERGGEIDGQVNPFEKPVAAKTTAEAEVKPAERPASKPAESKPIPAPVAALLAKAAMIQASGQIRPVQPGPGPQALNGSQPLTGRPVAAE